MGKPAKWVWVRSTVSPRLTVKITVPSSPASSTVHQSQATVTEGHRGVEKQLNETWLSGCSTNASSAIFSSAIEKVAFYNFLGVIFPRRGIERKSIESKKEPMQELARETQAQFRASLFPCAGLKLGVRHLLRPLTPRFTSPCNYICASAPCPSPHKDNVTICLFNCLSVTLLQAFSVGVYGFFFHLYLFIYLILSSGGLSGAQKQGVFVWPGFTWI